MENNNDFDITAVIPIRLGSTRCKNKNIRTFFDTNLLLRNINILKKVPEIKKIIISSSEQEILNFCISEDIEFHQRDPVFSQSNTTGSDLYKCLSDIIKTPYMMYVTCVTPFVDSNIYSHAINLFNKYIVNNDYDCVISCKNVKDFLWKDNQPLNYDKSNTPQSQLLPDIFNPTFAFNIISTEYVKMNSSIIGEKPYFYEIDQLSSMDIDTEYDFLASELLYKNGFENISQISHYISIPEKKDIYLLDCTIRDGGFINNWNYSIEEVLNYYQIISDSGIDFFECGFMFTDKNDSNGLWWNVTPELINKLKNDVQNSCKLSVMILFENITKLTYKIKGLDMIRILINLKKTTIPKDYIQHFKRLSDLGYILTINIAYIDILDETEIEKVFELSCEYISCIYIADTFGSLTEYPLLKLIKKFYNKFENIGFHGHNNLNLGVNNSLSAIDCGVKYIDCTISGIGRGGGNTATELLLLHLNKKENLKKYKLEPILKYLDKTLSNDDKLRIIYTISGIEKIHPDTVLDIFNKNDFNLINCYNHFI